MIRYTHYLWSGVNCYLSSGLNFAGEVFVTQSCSTLSFDIFFFSFVLVILVWGWGKQSQFFVFSTWNGLLDMDWNLSTKVMIGYLNFQGISNENLE